MELKLVLEFIKKYWVQSLIVILIAVIVYLNVSNSILESKLALAEQKNVQVEERLKVSNASISALEQAISTQNEELTKISTQGQEKIKNTQKALQEAKNNNLQLQEKIDTLEKDSYDSSIDECTNIKNLLKNVGE